MIDPDAVFFFEIRNVELLNIRKAFFKGVDVCQWTNQLQHVEVAGDEAGFNSLGRSLFGKHAHNIIGLVVIKFIQWPRTRFEQFV